MSIKIQPGQIQETATQVKESTGEGVADASVSSTGAASSDPVTQVAMDLIAGKISGEQAVDELVAQALDSGELKEAPSSLRTEVEELLRTTIETDPYLVSLVASLKD